MKFTLSEFTIVLVIYLVLGSKVGSQKKTEFSVFSKLEITVCKLQQDNITVKILVKIAP